MSARCALAFSLMISLVGCAELLGLDDYHVVNDAGRDGSVLPGRDAGSDAGCATRYRDFDEDTYGDPTTATTACDAPATFVSNGDDCNDHDGTIHPGANEVCDDADQDCDSAINEGLMAPIGDPIEITSIPCCASAHATVAAFDTAYLVAWQQGGLVHTLEIPLTGAVTATAGVVAAPVAASSQRSPRSMTVESGSAAGQIVVAWLEDSGVRIQVFPGPGVNPLPAVPLSAEPASSHTFPTQVGDNIVVLWATSTALNTVYARVFDPFLSATIGDVVDAPIPGADRLVLSPYAVGFASTPDTVLASLAALAGTGDRILLGHLDLGSSGGWRGADVELNQFAVTGPALLSRSNTSPNAFAIVSGEDAGGMMQACIATATPALDGASAPTMSSCAPFPIGAENVLALDGRGVLLSVLVVRGGVGLALLEYGDDLSTTGPAVDLGTVRSAGAASIAARRGGGIILFEDEAAGMDTLLRAQRFGCQ